jgi:hypothetical protein
MIKDNCFCRFVLCLFLNLAKLNKMVNLGAYAVGDKQFTLNAHVRERLVMWGKMIEGNLPLVDLPIVNLSVN